MDAAQLRNAQNIDILATDLQRKRDPVFAWSRTVSAMQGLLAARGVWPMSFIDSSGNIPDIGPLTLDLAPTTTPLLARHGAMPYIDFDTGDYLSSAGGDDAEFDILGTESYVATAHRGLSLGGWFKIDAVGTGDKYLLNKWQSASGNRSYGLYHNSTTLTFGVYDTGNTLFSVSLASQITAGSWFFAGGIYDPSTSLKVFHNSTTAENTTSIPSSLYNSTAVFAVGARSDGAQGIDGKASMCFLCAADIGEGVMKAVYHTGRAGFGI